MSFFPLRFLSDRNRPEFGRRTIALALTILIHILLLLLLLQLTPHQPNPVKAEHDLVTFSVLPAPKAATKHPQRANEGAAPKAPTPPVPQRAPEVKPAAALPFVLMSKEDFAAADVGKIKAPSGNGPNGAGAGKSGPSVYGPGEGPGGEQLFDADWYRKPTDAELAGYLPPNAPKNGWGLVACKTVDNYHVENCQSLGESPLGSGFARAVRQAAWQFLVKPPRIGGRSVVGAWVRIRIDYTQGVAQ